MVNDVHELLTDVIVQMITKGSWLDHTLCQSTVTEILSIQVFDRLGFAHLHMMHVCFQFEL